ncbi:[citrate (pro-3S)-lyase] ligase [Streptococcus rupicaprae]|uniref:[Citrate [pro-3S]-lyase] ligase n=1 Tax=Streptococcus rupicaprae TaxID=759619 RepID=A0ABV2FGB3_9STRE
MLVERLWIKQPRVKTAWLDLLDKGGIRPEANLEEVYGIYQDDCLIATGAIFDNVIKCVAVHPDYTGGAMISALLTELEVQVFEKYDRCYLYTKPEASLSFQHLGFKELVRVEDKLVFMEKAVRGLPVYLNELKSKYQPGKKQGAIVMNANPFTKGHLYLVEEAAKVVDALYLFVVSQDRSYVPFKDRFRLVEDGVAHLSNVVVVETGPYMVSTATFPSYFLPEEESVARVQANLDAQLFKTHIIPALGITHRFLGTEPKSQTTAIYNQELTRELADCLTLVIKERLEVEGQVISASLVRQLWQEKKLEEIKPLVPLTTYQYIKERIERKQNS